MLRNLPFLKELPDPVFEALLASGNLVRYGKGDSIWSPLRPAHITARGGHLKAEGGMACEGNGIFVVMAGLVKSSYSTAEGRTVVSALERLARWSCPSESWRYLRHACEGTVSGAWTAASGDYHDSLL